MVVFCVEDGGSTFLRSAGTFLPVYVPEDQNNMCCYENMKSNHNLHFVFCNDPAV